MAGASKRTRILLTGLPPMLREIVRDAVTAEPDMEVIGEFDDGTAFLRALAAADVVIGGTRDLDGAAFPDELLSAWPHVKVVMVTISGAAAAIFELQPHTKPLGDVSPGGLVDAIRSAIRHKPAQLSSPEDASEERGKPRLSRSQ